jgi:hypothetical protein
MLSHNKEGRHSVASQAVTSGESVKAAQAQLGHKSEQSTHKYAHLGSGAQRRLMEGLKPATAPHELAARAHVNPASTPPNPLPKQPNNKSKKALISQGLFL